MAPPRKPDDPVALEPEILPPEPEPLARPPEGRTFTPDGQVEDYGPNGRWWQRRRPVASERVAARGCGALLLRLAFVALVLGLFGALVLSLLSLLADSALWVAAWLRDAGQGGMAVVALAVARSTPLVVPAGLLAILPGYVWGTATGTAVVLAGAAVGGVINMLLARWFLGRWVRRRLEAHPALAALYQAIGARGFRILLALRLSPVAPYGLLAYVAGLAGIRIPTFVAASVLGGIPWTAVYAAFGAFLASRSEAARLDGMPDTPLTTALRIAGLLVTVAIAWWIARVARRDLAALRAQP